MFIEKELYITIFSPEINIYKDNQFVNNKFFPIGHFATEALNIDDESIALLKQYADTVKSVSASFKNPETDNLALQLSVLKETISEMIRVLCKLPPFTSWDADSEVRRLGYILCDSDMNSILKPGLIGGLFWRYIHSAASAAIAIQNFRDVGIFLEKNFLRNIPRRDEQSFATATNECFCNEDFLNLIFSSRFTDENFPFSPSLLSRFSFGYDPRDKDKLVFLDTIAFESYMDFFAYDLLNGMRHGHAPSKCQNCGRYFLSTDARKPKYCNGMAPQNSHYTCRQYGAMNQQKEKNANHPIFQVYKTRTGTIRKHHQRGKITDEERQEAMKVCVELRDRALFYTEFAQGEYLRLMEQDAIYAEVSRRLGYGDTHDQ